MDPKAAIAASSEPARDTPISATKLLGIFVRKECWRLSWYGRVLVILAGLVSAYAVVLNMHSFLAVTQRVDANVLVVEGWIHAYAIRGAVEEFRKGSYQRVFTTGGPVTGSGCYVNDYQTSASVGANLLKNVGMHPESLQMVPSRVVRRERTYSSAVALRDWFREHNLAIHSFNVLTENTHARRTRLLYQKAFGKNVAVGVIAVSNPDYDPTQWWCYSDGVREVVGESIAYLYAKFFFYPPASVSDSDVTQAAPASR